MFFCGAVVQGALLAIISAVLFVYGSVYLSPAPAMVMALGSAGTWLFVGYAMYTIMVLALGVTSLFYNYIEMGLGALKGMQSKLASAHFWLMNIGMIGSTWMIMYAGYIGGAGALMGLNPGQIHVQLIGSYPTPIAIFVVITILGLLAGGAVFVSALRKK